MDDWPLHLEVSCSQKLQCAEKLPWLSGIWEELISGENERGHFANLVLLWDLATILPHFSVPNVPAPRHAGGQNWPFVVRCCLAQCHFTALCSLGEDNGPPNKST